MKNLKLKKILKESIFPVISFINKLLPKNDKRVLLYMPSIRFIYSLGPLKQYLLENGYPQNYTGPGNSTQSEYDILWCMDSNLRHLELPIDMKGIYHCDSSGWPTDSNFFYDAVCNNWGCYIDAYRTFGAYNSEDSYFLGMYRPASTNQWESYCYYFDNAGARACSTLRGQGSWQIYDGNE